MDRSQRFAARIFAVAYIASLAIVMIVFPRFYAPYLVWENGVETARRFVAHEQAIRTYLAGGLLHGVGAIVALTALYVILRTVNRGMALFAAFSKLTYAMFWFVNLLCVFGALHVLGSAASLRTFGSEGLVALAGSQLDLSRDAYYIGLAFNGLGSAVFAWVLFQSRYVPRLLAAWGIVACLYEGVCGFVYLVNPGFGAILSVNWYELPSMTFEVLLCLWFLFGRPRSPQIEVTDPHGATGDGPVC